MKLSLHIKAFALMVVFLLTGSTTSLAYNKLAFLVGISDYGNPNNDPNKFRNINGTSDIEILKPILRKQGFKISQLLNSRATYAAIIAGLNNIIQKSQPGDIVYLHFSMHGQLVEDLNGDEDDGWDEALVPYDAKLKYKKGVYEGQKHLIDDELAIYISKIRKKIGNNGYLYVVLDACHSGTFQRDPVFEDALGIAKINEGEDEENGPVRGADVFSRSGKRFDADRSKKKEYFRIKPEAGKSPVVFLEACQPFEENREIKRGGKCYGPLTYHVVETIKSQNISKDGKWVEAVKAGMDNDSIIKNRPIIQRQHMMIERTY